MHAIQFRRFGGPDVLEFVELPDPVPGPGQVRLRVRIAGVNFAETLMRENRYAITPSLPTIPGNEAVGIIDAVGPDVSGLVVGQRVAAALFAGNVYFGGYAEQVVVDAALALPIPDGIGDGAAAALLVQGFTALALSRHVPMADRSVIVTAAAGGVGCLLVQLLREAGAKRIIALASGTTKTSLAMSLGAHAAIDYRAEGWAEAVRAASPDGGPDVICDSVGGDFTPAALDLLAPRGIHVIYGALNIQRFALGVPELLRLIFRNQQIAGFAMAPLLTPARVRTDWVTLCHMHTSGKLRTIIGTSLPLAHAADAHRALASRTSTGKIVLTA